MTADNSVGNAPAIQDANLKKVEEMSEADEAELGDETSITEMLAFAKSFAIVLNTEKTGKLQSKTRFVFALRGQHEVSDSTKQRIDNIRATVEQLQACMAEA